MYVVVPGYPFHYTRNTNSEDDFRTKTYPDIEDCRKSKESSGSSAFYRYFNTTYTLGKNERITSLIMTSVKDGTLSRGSINRNFYGFSMSVADGSGNTRTVDTRTPVSSSNVVVDAATLDWSTRITFLQVSC
jgi:hypothetical protein